MQCRCLAVAPQKRPRACMREGALTSRELCVTLQLLNFEWRAIAVATPPCMRSAAVIAHMARPRAYAYLVCARLVAYTMRGRSCSKTLQPCLQSQALEVNSNVHEPTYGIRTDREWHDFTKTRSTQTIFPRPGTNSGVHISA